MSWADSDKLPICWGHQREFGPRQRVLDVPGAGRSQRWRLAVMTTLAGLVILWTWRRSRGSAWLGAERAT